MNKFKQFFTFLIVTFIFIIIYFMSYNFAESKAYDFMIKNFTTKKFLFDKKKNIHGSDDILLIVIDAKTVEKYRWPWKREKYSILYEFLNLANAKIIIHDALITTLDSQYPNSDKKYFKSVNKLKNLIVGFMPRPHKWENPKEGEVFETKFAKKFGLKVTDNTKMNTILYNSMLSMPDDYFNVIHNIGSVTIFPGFINGNISKWGIDEIYRNHEYIVRYKGNYYPSFALKTYLMLNNNPQIEINDKYLKFKETDYSIPHKKSYYQLIVPMKFYNLYDSGYSHKNYSAIDIIDSYNAIKQGKKPIINPDEFKNKIVLIGANVPAGAGLNDNKNTPVSISHPGVDIQATAIDNILHNDFLKIIPQNVNLILTLLTMLIVYCFIKTSGLYKSIFNTIFIILTYLILSMICFYFGIVVNIITPIIMFVLTTIIAYSNKFVLENKNKEKVKSAMGKYMSQDVMKRVIQDIDNLGLGGKRAIVTVLFSDIRGFTTMSEQMSPQEVSEILNEYFTEMEPIITKYNGVINKFIGDAVMAIFGEPIQDKQHPQNAVKCAYEMLKKVKSLQKKWSNENKPKIEIGIGIATGEVFVGNIGSVNRMEYTVIGDTVNLASRLESYNKVYKTNLLISQATYEEVKGFVDVIRISDVQIRGKSNKMDIFEVLKIQIHN